MISLYRNHWCNSVNIANLRSTRGTLVTGTRRGRGNCIKNASWITWVTGTWRGRGNCMENATWVTGTRRGTALRVFFMRIDW